MKQTIGIASGYFNPLHVGHVRYLEMSKTLCDKLFVIVNNDFQQVMKKGRIIMYEGDRMEIVEALGCVDMAIVSIDTDETVCESIEYIAEHFDNYDIIFINGGDRDSKEEVPETVICNNLNIKMIFNAGGPKMESSTNINRLTGKEDG